MRDEEVGTSQSDITPKSRGGPLNFPLHKMVHFNVKQSLCCFLQAGSFGHLLRVSSSNREKTNKLWIAKFSPSKRFELKRQNEPVFSPTSLNTHSHEVVVISSESNVWNCQGSCDRDASIACNTKQNSFVVGYVTVTSHTYYVWFWLHDHVTNCSVWLVNNKDGSGLQPTPKINSVDNSVTLWLLNLLLIQWQTDTDSRAVQLFSLLGYLTGQIC